MIVVCTHSSLKIKTKVCPPVDQSSILYDDSENLTGLGGRNSLLINNFYIKNVAIVSRDCMHGRQDPGGEGVSEN